MPSVRKGSQPGGTWPLTTNTDLYTVARLHADGGVDVDVATAAPRPGVSASVRSRRRCPRQPALRLLGIECPAQDASLRRSA